MGRLKVISYAKAWVLPVAIALALVFGVHVSLADPKPTLEELTEYLQTDSLSVGAQPVAGFSQIYYTYNGNAVYVTEDDGHNRHSPVASDEFVAWVETIDGAGQIFLHNVLTETTTQITNEGTNLSPAIYLDQIVWQKWVDESWQIYYYDGLAVRRLSNSDGSAIRAKIEEGRAVYAEQLAQSGQWRVVLHDLQAGEAEVIETGNEAIAWPRFEDDGTIKTELGR